MAEPTAPAAAQAPAIAQPATPATSIASDASAPVAPQGPVAPLGAIPAHAPPAIADATSHVHLVLGDDEQRVVVTVAVRGADVRVVVRGADDHATAALARNAGLLDEALRHRGLQLAELSTTDDAGEQRHAPPHRDQDDLDPETQRDAEPFVLEQDPS
jgi:hypothetical protein